MLKLKGHYSIALINKDSLSKDVVDLISSEKSSVWDLIQNKKITPDQIIEKDNLVSDQGLFQLNGQGQRGSFSQLITFDSMTLFLSQSVTQERTGTAQAGTVSSITLDAGASATNSFYNGASITILSGTGSGQTRVISAYVGTTKVATVSVNWATNPDNTSVFHISPLVDYRKQTGIMGFTIDATGTPTNVVQTGTSFQGEFNFPAPVSTRTVNIIGMKLDSSLVSGNILTFINLSTPISQTTSHLLFVRYILQGSYSNLTGIGGVTNAWVQDRVNSAIFSNHTFASGHFCMSRFLNPVNYNKVGRQAIYLRNSAFGGAPLATVTKTPSKFRISSTWSLLSADLPGPHAAGFANLSLTNPGGGDLQAELPIISVFEQVQTPNIGTMFKHAAGDTSIFSNPGNPPTSLGNLTVTGTSTIDKIFKKISALFTQSGDASNIIPETFTRNGNQLVVAQDWTNAALGSIVTCTLSTTGTLPSPLLPSTTYYIIYDDATHIRLATSQSNAIAGTHIPLTDDGTGVHTITRTSTGKFKLAVNAYRDAATGGRGIDCSHVNPMFLGSNIQNASGVSYSDTPASGPGANVYKNRAVKVSWGALVGDFLYFCQEEISTTNQWICKWRFNTLEGGESLVSVNLQNGAVSFGTNVWIATDNGLVKFDTVTDTITATYTISNGLLETKINDICIDPVTNLIWLGHDTGLTKWNPTSSLVVTTHTNGVSNTFNGLNATQVKVLRGQLTAYNGIVCWGGKLSYDTVTQPTNSDRDGPRIYDNNTGFWVRIPTSSFSTTQCQAVALVGDGTANIVADVSGSTIKMDVWTVTLTGAGTGTFTLLQTQTNVNSTFFSSRIHRISKDHFSFLPVSDTKHIAQMDYTISNNAIFLEENIGNTGDFFQPGALTQTISSNMFEVNGVKLLWKWAYIFGTGVDQLFGWTGSAWDRDTLTARDIPDTTITNVMDGINFNFDNAGGQPSTSQFILNENMMIVSGPGTIKSNLQTMTYKMFSYSAELKSVVGRSISVPGVAAYTYTAPEAAVTDFVSIEDDSSYIVILDGSTPLTQVPSAPAAGQYSVNALTGVFTFNSAEAGKTLDLSFYYVERH